MLFRLLIVAVLLACTVALSRWVPRHPRWRSAVVVLNLVVTVRYLWWRATDTLNWAGGWDTAASLALYTAEIYGFLVVLHHYMIATRSRVRRAAPPDPAFSPAVDVLVPTYNEGMEILYRTLAGCVALDYPNRTIHVLDDGRRPEVAELCRQFGVNYLAREDNRGAKAGNLNHALARTEGTLVVTLDADHVPVASFLRDTVGFFRDPQVALVQTAHHFYNPDLFQDRLRIRSFIANEQDMFYHVVQPGRDVSNSSFYCGSGAIFRRAALQEIGGFPDTTVTEDLHTSVLLHARGWQSVYVNRDLSAGLAPESYEAYLTQRRRWARGTFQVLLSHGGLFLRGLRAMQRLNYFATLWYWLYGFPRIVFLISPLLFLLGGLRPLVVNDVFELLTYYLPHIAVSIVAFQLVNRGMRRVFWSDVYESCISVQVALTGLLFPLSPGRSRFIVTPKGSQAAARERSALLRLGWPLLALSGMTVVGLAVGLWRLGRGGDQDGGTLINVVWAAYNLVVLGFGLLILRPAPQRRGTIRLPRRRPALLAWNGTRVEGVTTDLSETGVSLILSPPRSIPGLVDVTVYGSEGLTVTCRARLVRCDLGVDGALSCGLEIVERNEEQHRRLVQLMFSEPDAWSGPHARTMGAPEHLARIARSVFAIFAAGRVLRRLAPRFSCDLEAGLRLEGGAEVRARVVDVSASGAALRLAPGQGVPSPERFQLTLQWNPVERTTVEARVRHVRPAAGGGRLLGVVFLDLDSEQRRDLAKHLYGRSERTAALELKAS